MDNRTWNNKISDAYLEYPIMYDCLISSCIAICHYFIITQVGYLILFKVETLSDILNELISSSLSAGGFVLAALAILASTKQTVSKPKEKTRIKQQTKSSEEIERNTGKQFFYNSRGYGDVIRMYGLCCIVFIFLFVLFLFSRTAITFFDPDTTLQILIFGISMLILSFLRCIFLLWTIIQIK